MAHQALGMLFLKLNIKVQYLGPESCCRTSVVVNLNYQISRTHKLKCQLSKISGETNLCRYLRRTLNINGALQGLATWTELRARCRALVSTASLMQIQSDQLPPAPDTTAFHPHEARDLKLWVKTNPSFIRCFCRNNKKNRCNNHYA